MYLFVVVPIQELQSDSENMKFKLLNHVFPFQRGKTKGNLISTGDIVYVDHCNVTNCVFQATGVIAT